MINISDMHDLRLEFRSSFSLLVELFCLLSQRWENWDTLKQFEEFFNLHSIVLWKGRFIHTSIMIVKRQLPFLLHFCLNFYLVDDDDDSLSHSRSNYNRIYRTIWFSCRFFIYTWSTIIGFRFSVFAWSNPILILQKKINEQVYLISFNNSIYIACQQHEKNWGTFCFFFQLVKIDLRKTICLSMCRKAYFILSSAAASPHQIHAQPYTNLIHLNAFCSV